MTQFEDPYADPMDQGEVKTSGLAVTSLISSLIFFCPITTVLGPILGLVAIVSIGNNPARKGKGLAAAAIVLGLVFTAGQTVVGYWLYTKGSQVYQFMMTGPSNALNAGFGGDYAGFRAEFYGDGAIASDEEVAAFLDTLTARYGAFNGCFINQATQQQPAPGDTSFTVPYQLNFAQTSVECEAELVLADPNTGGFVMKIGYVNVFDEENGDVRFPAEP